MKNLMLVSTQRYAGKTGLAINLVKELRDRGRGAGYFKPVGNLAVSIDGQIRDRDAVFAKQALDLEFSEDSLCPLVLTSTETVRTLKNSEDDDARRRIETAFLEARAVYDPLVIEGSGHINDGRLHNSSAVELAGALDADVVLVEKVENIFEIADDLLVAADRFGERFAGVILNWAAKTQIDPLRSTVVPFLARRSIACFGIMPKDDSLQAVSVDQLTKSLGGRFLCGKERGDNMVETFMVGAMGQEQALRFFRRRARKAVVTGGDRADVQLAALETSTSCLILTGDYTPPQTVISVAEAKGVPMVLVGTDTLTTVERTESLIGQTRVHDPVKLEGMRQIMRKNLDIDRLCSVVG